MRYQSGSSSNKSKSSNVSKLKELMAATANNPFYSAQGGQNIPQGGTVPSGDPLLEGMNILAKLGGRDWAASTRAPQPEAPVLEDSAVGDADDVVTQQLMNQLTSMFGGVNDYDPSADIQAAVGGIQQQYNPQIQMLKNQNTGARKETNANMAKISAMYEALNRSMQKDAEGAAAADKRSAQGYTDTGKRVAQSIQGNVDEQLNQNAAMSKGLGSGDLLKELNMPVQEQAGQAAQRAQQTGLDAATANSRIGAASQRSMREVGSSTKLEGAEQNANLMSQLQDFVQQNMTQASSLRGQRAQAIAQARSQIMNSAASGRQDANESMWQGLMDIAKLNQGRQSTAFDQDIAQQELLAKLQGDGGKSPYPKGMQNANSILEQLIGQGADPGRVNEVYSDVLSQGQSGSRFNLSNPSDVQAALNAEAPNAPAWWKEQIAAAILAANS